MFATANFRILPLLTCSFFAIAILPSFAQAQLPQSAIVVSEFFEEIHLLNLANQSVTDILDSPIGASPFGQNIEVLNPNTIAITSFSDLYYYDVGSQTASLFTSLSFFPSEITRDGNGDLVASSTSMIPAKAGTTNGLRLFMQFPTKRRALECRMAIIRLPIESTFETI